MSTSPSMAPSVVVSRPRVATDALWTAPTMQTCTGHGDANLWGTTGTIKRFTPGDLDGGLT
jgi:hypothetical protein